MAALVSKEDLEPIRPDLNTKPRVYYKNLHRYTKLFVAGEVLAIVNGVTDCLANAKVVLSSQGKELAATQTDPFGEYKIDELNPEIGNCELIISHEEFSTKTFGITLDGESVVSESLLLEGKT
jgi:hypothetical protein